MITFPIGGAAELEGAAYLYNLSLLAIVFTAVSALVMMVRLAMGRRLSGFDIYLIKADVSFGFVIALSAVLPPLILMFGLTRDSTWIVASGIAAVLTAANLTNVVRLRRKAAKESAPPIVLAAFGVYGAVVVALAVNTVAADVRGAALFSGALTLCLGNVMWSLVRRIS